MAQAQAEGQTSEQKAQALSASLHRQSGVSIQPNNSFLETLPVVHYQGVYVRHDGDVIRIELPGNQLFESGGARSRPGAANLIADVAAELRRTYPDQIVGVEGHTDSDPVVGGQLRNNHELSIARGDGGLRRADWQHAIASRAALRRGTRGEPSGGFQCDPRGEAAEPAG